MVPDYSPSLFSVETLERYAETLLWGLNVARGRPLKKSALVLVRYDPPALPLAEAVTGLLHKTDRIPIPRAGLSARMEHDFYRYANNKRLSHPIPGEEELLAAVDGVVSLLAPESQTHLATIDPEQMTIHQRSRAHLKQLQSRREALGELGWTVGLYPTRGLADLAGCTLEDYAAQIRSACRLDQADPVLSWKLYQREAQAIRQWLDDLDIRSLRIQGDSMDLLVGLGERRRWITLTGRNIPSYEYYTTPDWRTVEGVFLADQPTYVAGSQVRGLRLEFRMGEAIRVEAEEGHPAALARLTTDHGANKVGEVALVDKRFSPIARFMANTLYDENHGGEHGSCHIALGQSYINAYAGEPASLDRDRKRIMGFNESAIHWDVVNTQPKVVTANLADGARKTIYENGAFLQD